MNNEQYLKKLKQALSGLDKEERDNILREISSYAEDSCASLEDRLGPVDELAQQYLDGTPPSLPLAKKAWSVGKKVLMGFGAAVALFILLGVIGIWYLSKDDFNYADISASELNLQKASWSSKEVSSPLTIEADQAKVVLYWSEDNQLHWNCKDASNLPIENNVVKVRHNSCLLFVPAQNHNITTDQSSLVIVEPKASVAIKAKQSSIQLSEGGKRYYYHIAGERFVVSDELLSDQEAGITLKMEVFETSIELYEY